jgi:hypothetical protein
MINLMQSTRLVSLFTRFIVITGLAILVLTYPGFSQTDISVSIGDNPDTNYANDYGNNAVGYFYDSLLPYGQWVMMPDNTWAWEPYNMPVDWQPYTLGHWAYTDYGWTWVSDEPWGWACFHYGRWEYNDDYGWLWYPGMEWGPAWVVWRTSDDWIGWAPCPRNLHWRYDRGFDLSNINLQVMIASHNFCFIPSRFILDRDLHRRIMPVTWNTRVFPITRPELRYTIENHRIVNQLPIQQPQLERIIGRPIPKMNIFETDKPGARISIQNRENTIQLYKPDFRTMPRTEQQSRFQNMPRITIPTPPSAITNQQKSALRTIQATQEAENRALQRKHIIEQQSLHEQQQREITRPPVSVPREQIQQQQQAENQALQEKMQREQRLLQNYHEQENMIKTAPQAPPARRFEIQPSQSKEQYQRMQQYEKEQRNQERTPNIQQKNNESSKINRVR